MPDRRTLKHGLVGAALIACLVAAGDARANGRDVTSTIVAWNEAANGVALAAGDVAPAFKGVRAQAMTHIAQHDALNAVHAIFEPYAYRGAGRRASPVAAAAAAAHDVLVAEYPEQRSTVDSLLDRQLAELPAGRATAAGIALGRRSAAAILTARSGDGYDFEGTYVFQDRPGAYRTTPPFDGFVLQPGFRHARPFALAAPDQLRPGPPPQLGSRAYAAALDEVRRRGRVDSTVRTPEETGYALWWMEFTENSVNRLTRRLVRHVHPWRAARLFAQLNAGQYDAYVATWDSKFEYNHWRPYTAIRETMDPTWEPLRTTPPFPDYVSAHAAACGASFGILARAFGDRTRFTMDSTTAPAGMPTRSFRSFSAAAAECADSRVQLGFHFRYATDAGRRLGERVAEVVASRRFRPRG